MYVTATTQLQFFWRDAFPPKEFRSGVSLHSHTMYSQESLDVVPGWIVKHYGLDLRNGFWTPPLTARQAYRLEQKQIEAQFGIPALVSLTDHDNIRAGMLLRVLDRFRDAPISTEWTVPFGSTFFHFGVHNLRRAQAESIMSEMADFTSNPEPKKLAGLLRMLNSDPEVLVVVNHPLWDEKGIGRAEHVATLRNLLNRHAPDIHALEVNGLRSWSENERVIRFGRGVNLPVVAGGDRHGLEPNAIVNLSRGTTIQEFAREVRYQRFSHIVLMPQYRQCRKLRIARMVLDVLRDYPGMEVRRNWGDRVFCRNPATGVSVPLAAFASGSGVRLVESLLAAVRLVEKRSPSAILTSA